MLRKGDSAKINGRALGLYLERKQTQLHLLHFKQHPTRFTLELSLIAVHTGNVRFKPTVVVELFGTHVAVERFPNAVHSELNGQMEMIIKTIILLIEHYRANLPCEICASWDT